jgi:hypothetical protein
MVKGYFQSSQLGKMFKFQSKSSSNQFSLGSLPPKRKDFFLEIKYLSTGLPLIFISLGKGGREGGREYSPQADSFRVKAKKLLNLS